MFPYPLKTTKSFWFLIFSGGIEMEHWPEGNFLDEIGLNMMKKN